MKSQEPCRVYGEHLTPESAPDLVEERIEYELSKSGILSRYPDTGPQYDNNHEYWKKKLHSQLSLFRQKNLSGELIGGKPIYTSNLSEFLELEERANKGEITFREAYTQILKLDHIRNARLKDRINAERCIAELQSLKESIQ